MFRNRFIFYGHNSLELHKSCFFVFDIVKHILFGIKYLYRYKLKCLKNSHKNNQLYFKKLLLLNQK